MKRINRGRRLTRNEAAKYKTVRQQVAKELPDLIARHHGRMATLDQRRLRRERGRPRCDRYSG